MRECPCPKCRGEGFLLVVKDSETTMCQVKCRECGLVGLPVQIYKRPSDAPWEKHERHAETLAVTHWDSLPRIEP